MSEEHEPPPLQRGRTATNADGELKTKERLANLAAIWGVLSWSLLPVLGAIPAVYYGHKALRQAKADPENKGRRRALIGLWCGYFWTLGVVGHFLPHPPKPDQAEKSGAEAGKVTVVEQKADTMEAKKFSLGLFGENGVITNGVAVTEQRTVHTMSAEIEGYKAAQAVYRIAKELKDIKSVKVVFYMVPVGLVDKYGNTVSGPLLMGEISESDLDEVRKYRDEYAYANRVKALFAARISRMDQAYLFKK